MSKLATWDHRNGALRRVLARGALWGSKLAVSAAIDGDKGMFVPGIGLCSAHISRRGRSCVEGLFRRGVLLVSGQVPGRIVTA